MVFNGRRPWMGPVFACCLAAASTVAATIYFGQWLVFIPLAIVAIACFSYIIQSYWRIRRNVAFVLDAAENDDFTFRYRTAGSDTPDGQVNAYLNRLIDILERLTDDIREKDRFYEVILNSAENGIIVADKDGNVIHSNRAARKMLHADVIANIKHLARVHPSLPQSLYSQTINLTLTDGSELSLSATHAELTLHGQQVDIISLSDISRTLESKELESWEKLTRVLTHEIMNSLTPVISICDALLADTDATTQDFYKGITTVTSTGKGLKRFVENYRSFANIPAPNPKPFYAKPFLEMMKDVCLHQFPGIHPNVEIDCRPADLMLYADEHLSGQVVTNILKNAIQATADTSNPKISISARLLADETIEIEISNNGPLISPETASQIFMPFFTTKPDGSGIGLSVSRRIMAAAGGSLTLRPRPHTAFILTFP